MDLYNGNSRWYVKYHTKNVGNISGCFWPLPSKKCPDEKVKFKNEKNATNVEKMDKKNIKLKVVV